MKEFISGNVSLYDAHDAMDDNGKLEPAVTKLKTFRNYINADSFEKSVRSSEETYKNSKYEVVSTVDYPRLHLGSLDLSIASNVQKRENYLNN